MTDDGLMQLNAAGVVAGADGVSVGDGVTVGVTVPVGVDVPVPVGEGVGVVPPETMVKASCALRCVIASLADMVCCPLDQAGLTVTLTLNVPFESAFTVSLVAGCNN